MGCGKERLRESSATATGHQLMGNTALTTALWDCLWNGASHRRAPRTPTREVPAPVGRRTRRTREAGRWLSQRYPPPPVRLESAQAAWNGTPVTIASSALGRIGSTKVGPKKGKRSSPTRRLGKNAVDPERRTPSENFLLRLISALSQNANAQRRAFAGIKLNEVVLKRRCRQRNL
jgi:hypothetical protein